MSKTTCAECAKRLFGPLDAPSLPARLSQRRILRWVCSTCGPRLLKHQPSLAFSCVRVELLPRGTEHRLLQPWCYAVVDPSV